MKLKRIPLNPEQHKAVDAELAAAHRRLVKLLVRLVHRYPHSMAGREALGAIFSLSCIKVARNALAGEMTRDRAARLASAGNSRLNGVSPTRVNSSLGLTNLTHLGGCLPHTRPRDTKGRGNRQGETS